MFKYVSNISLYSESKQSRECVWEIVFSEVKSPLHGLVVSCPGENPETET